MSPIMLACNMGSLGGLFLMVVIGGAMGIVGLITTIVFAVQLSSGSKFSTAGWIARSLTCTVLLAPSLFAGVTMLG